MFQIGNSIWAVTILIFLSLFLSRVVESGGSKEGRLRQQKDVRREIWEICLSKVTLLAGADLRLCVKYVYCVGILFLVTRSQN